MSDKKVTMHRRESKGMSEAMANELNRHQATRTLRKMGARKIVSPKPKQGFTQHRPGVDHL